MGAANMWPETDKLIRRIGNRKVAGPRRPERANGVERFELLLRAAERLLERDGIDALTIQRVAQEAGIAMASTYHFFPHPGAVSIAVAERYLSGFASAIRAPIARAQQRPWQEVVQILMRRTVRFYGRHPYARTLILGSDYSRQIREADLSNNRAMAETIYDIVAPHFSHISREDFLQTIVVAISIGDAVWALSVARYGRITKRLSDEAISAVCAYLSVKDMGRAPL